MFTTAHNLSLINFLEKSKATQQLYFSPLRISPVIIRILVLHQTIKPCNHCHCALPLALIVQVSWYDTVVLYPVQYYSTRTMFNE